MLVEFECLLSTYKNELGLSKEKEQKTKNKKNKKQKTKNKKQKTKTTKHTKFFFLPMTPPLLGMLWDFAIVVQELRKITIKLQKSKKEELDINLSSSKEGGKEGGGGGGRVGGLQLVVEVPPTLWADMGTKMGCFDFCERGVIRIVPCHFTQGINDLQKKAMVKGHQQVKNMYLYCPLKVLIF